MTELLTGALSTDGLVDVEEPVWTFEADGEIAPGEERDAHRWTYREGVAELAARLLGPVDASVEFETPVRKLERDGDGWRLLDPDGASLGSYGAVLLILPDVTS